MKNELCNLTMGCSSLSTYCLARQELSASQLACVYISIPEWDMCVLFMQHFSKMDTQGESCPEQRFRHAAVSLGYGGDHPQLLVTGGWGSDLDVLSDLWMLDMQSGRWREVRV